MKYTNQKGFVALISAVIIAALLVGLCFGASDGQFAARGAALHDELHAMSVYIAKSCGETALYDISQNFTYTVPINGENIPIGNLSCSIVSITYDSENVLTHQKPVTIETSAEYRGADVDEQVQADIQDPNFAKSNSEQQNITNISWTELP